MTTALASCVSRLERRCRHLTPADHGALWTPRSAQRMALESEADEVYYGRAAGGGKTDLLIGAAITRHRRSMIFRREYAQHSAIIDRVSGGAGRIAEQVSYNGTERRWRLPAAVPGTGRRAARGQRRKWRGRPHDGKFFDELPEFTEAQYLFFGGWARTTVPGHRVRRIEAGNPPTDTDGEWVIRGGDRGWTSSTGPALPGSCAGSSGSTARTPRSKGRSRSSGRARRCIRSPERSSGEAGR